MRNSEIRESSIFFSSFLLVTTKLLFWEENWALAYNSIKFSDFPDLSRIKVGLILLSEKFSKR